MKVRASSTDQLVKIIDEIGAVEGVAVTETMIFFGTVKEESNIRV